MNALVEEKVSAVNPFEQNQLVILIEVANRGELLTFLLKRVYLVN